MNGPFTDYGEDELILPARLPSLGTLCAFAIPRNLTERRIYLFLDLISGAGVAWNLDSTVVLEDSGRIVAELPARVSDFTGVVPNQSRGTLFNAGGSPVGDSLVLKIAQPFDVALPSVVIQPTRINCVATKIYVRLNRLDGNAVTGFRSYLACLSTEL